MQDVARRAGVSPMTVSNVVNGRPHVATATRDRVLAAVEELGYRVNTTARNLRQGRTGVIGLAVPEIDRPYFGLLASWIIQRAALRGLDVVVEQTGSRREAEMAAIQKARLRSYDGLLLHASQLANEDATLLRGDYPIVVLGERAYAQPVDHVVMGNREGGRLAAHHLVARGCRHVVMVGGRVHAPDPHAADVLRTQGFLEGLTASALARSAHGEGGVDRVWPADWTTEAGRRVVSPLLAALPEVDGIFGATDSLALGVLRGLADAGRRVPDEVAMVGFDDVPAASWSVPSLTSLSPDHEAMAEAAVDLLVSRIGGSRSADDYCEVVADVRLVERESTAGFTTGSRI